MKKLVILISGKQGSGKTTCANILEAYDPTEVQLLAFSTRLKHFVHELFGLSLENLYGQSQSRNDLCSVKWDRLPKELSHEKSGFMTYREVLEVFASVCRALDLDCWVRPTYNKIARSNYDIVVVHDVRYPNELKWEEYLDPDKFLVKKIRLLRDVCKSRTEPETALDNHPLTDFDIVFPEDSSLTNYQSILLRKLDEWIEQQGE